MAVGLRGNYSAFNEAVGSLYGDSMLLLDGRKPPFEFDDGTFRDAARMVYEAGGFDLSQLTDTKARAVIDETLRVLSTAIDSGLPHEVPETLRHALENNAFIFSGFKTFHALREVGLSMVTDKGDIKPYNDFLKDVLKINNRYNHNYLYAEYNHALGTSQMAAKWHAFEQDGDRYDLQYRTAGDGRVREEHAMLHGITLPPSDPFWDKYLAPNGWNCRCDAVQVRKGKYERTDPKLAMTRGDNCTDALKQRMFRYNPGKTMELFPPKHPYYPKGCGNCNQLKLYTPVDKGLPACQACGVIMQQCLANQKKMINQWKNQSIPEQGGLKIKGSNFKTGSLTITRGSVKETVNHTFNIAVRNSLFGIDKNALTYEYIGWAPCRGGKHQEAAFFLYYKVVIGGNIYYANVKAYKATKAEQLYCIRDKCKLADLRTDEPPTPDKW